MRKTIKIWWFILLNMFTGSARLSRINRKDRRTRKKNLFDAWWLYARQSIRQDIKEKIGIENIDDTKKLIDTDDKLPDDINLKNVVLLMTCVIEDYGIF